MVLIGTTCLILWSRTVPLQALCVVKRQEMKERKKTAARTKAKDAPQPEEAATGPRERIMGAAFAVLTEKGYTGASTLEIATRARVSKRELYTLFGDKRGILVAMIASRAAR